MTKCPVIIPEFKVNLPNDKLVGLMSLYAAITIHSMNDCWVWLTKFINHPPILLSPLVVYTFLRIALPEFIRVYQKQGWKIVAYLIGDWGDKCHKQDVAHTTRLKLFLEETLARRRVEELEGSKMED